MNELLYDPEFLKWEYQQVGDPVSEDVAERRSRVYTERFKEPMRWFKYRHGNSSARTSQVVQPMFDIRDTYYCRRDNLEASADRMEQAFDGSEPGDAIL